MKVAKNQYVDPKYFRNARRFAYFFELKSPSHTFSIESCKELLFGPGILPKSDPKAPSELEKPLKSVSGSSPETSREPSRTLGAAQGRPRSGIRALGARFRDARGPSGTTENLGFP